MAPLSRKETLPRKKLRDDGPLGIFREASLPKNVILTRCGACHSDSGIPLSRAAFDGCNGRLARLAKMMIGDPIRRGTEVSMTRKAQQPDFKLLESLWKRPSD